MNVRGVKIEFGKGAEFALIGHDGNARVFRRAARAFHRLWERLNTGKDAGNMRREISVDLFLFFRKHRDMRMIADHVRAKFFGGDAVNFAAERAADLVTKYRTK